MSGLLNGVWLVELRAGFRFPNLIQSKDATERRKLIEELWAQDPSKSLLQIDVYGDGQINVSFPPKEIA